MNGRVTTAAIKWWESNRPLSYSLEDHLKNPTINTVNKSEKELAEAVAEYFINSIQFHRMLDS